VPAVIAIVAPLSLDTFALALALGASGLPARERLRVSLLLAAFEGGMPLLGLALGTALASVVGSWVEIAAGVLLIGVGLSMLREGTAAGTPPSRLADAHGLRVLGIGVAVAIDEFAMGFTLGLLDVNITLIVTLIAAQALIAAQLGLRLGARLNQRWGEVAEKLAGLALAGYGVYLIVDRAAWPG
jgi:putative Mn2+ efflux pump MntP